MSAILYHNVHLGLVAGTGLDAFDFAKNVHPLHDVPEHDVLVVKMRSVPARDEELRPVGARPSVGHAEQPALRVLHDEVLVGELFAVNGLAALSVVLWEMSMKERGGMGE